MKKVVHSLWVDKNDARSITSEEQHLLRVKGVEMVFKQKLSKSAAARILGVSRQHPTRWCQSFEEGGYQALELGRRGRKPVETRMLKPFQCAAIVNIIRDKTPDWVKLPFLLWERVAVSNKGTVRFMIYYGKMNQQTFIGFLKRLVGSTDKKVYFIVDSLKVHHGKLVMKWLESKTEQIELFFIPPHSPELNPDEYLNRDLKRNVSRSRVPRRKSDLKKNLLSFMGMLQRILMVACFWARGTLASRRFVGYQASAQ